LIIWLLAEPVLNWRGFVVSIPGLFFDLHPNRIFTLVFIILIVHELHKAKKGKSETSKFGLTHNHEYVIAFYLLTVLVSTAINTMTGGISLKHFLLINSGQWYFLLTYLCTKMFLDDVARERIIRILIAFSIFNVFLVLIQMTFDRSFFGFGVTRLAFGDVYRAPGIFHNEYTQAFFHITIIIFLLTRPKKHLSLVLLNIIPVALSFHRLSWAILLAAGFYYMILQPHRVRILAPTLCSLILLLTSLIYFYGFQGITFADISDTIFYRQRLADDTLGGRLDQWMNALNILKSHFFGMGTYDSDSYLAAAARIGQLQDIEIFDTDMRQVIGTKTVGLIVHNGFLSAGVKYGIPGAITFFLMCFLMFRFHLNRYRQSKTGSNARLLLCVFMWVAYQTTQDFSDLLSYHSIFFAILLTLGQGDLIGSTPSNESVSDGY
jgi:O-antigen ligase